MMDARLIRHNGSPAISINGELFPPMTMTITTCRIAIGKEGRELDFNYFKELGKAGIRIFYVMCNNLDIDKNAIEEFEEEANLILSAIPDAYFMVRLCLHPSEEWCENNPDEMMQYTDGRELPTLLTAESIRLHLKSFPSLCSEKWRKDMGDTMLETIRRIKALPCGERIAGIFLAAGGLFADGTILVDLISKHLNRKVNFIVPTLPQIYGACYKCLRLYGKDKNEFYDAFKENYENYIKINQ